MELNISAIVFAILIVILFVTYFIQKHCGEIYDEESHISPKSHTKIFTKQSLVKLLKKITKPMIAIFVLITIAVVARYIYLDSYGMTGVLICPNSDGYVDRIDFETGVLQRMSVERYCKFYDKKMVETEKKGNLTSIVLYSIDGKNVLYRTVMKVKGNPVIGSDDNIYFTATGWDEKPGTMLFCLRQDGKITLIEDILPDRGEMRTGNDCLLFSQDGMVAKYILSTGELIEICYGDMPFFGENENVIYFTKGFGLPAGEYGLHRINLEDHSQETLDRKIIIDSVGSYNQSDNSLLLTHYDPDQAAGIPGVIAIYDLEKNKLIDLQNYLRVKLVRENVRRYVMFDEKRAFWE